VTLGVEQRHLQPAHVAAVAIRRNLRKLGLGIGALHRREHAAGRNEVAAGGEKIHEARETTRDDDGEARRRAPLLRAVVGAAPVAPEAGAGGMT